MLRLDLAEGEYYHIYSRGTEKRDIFLDDKDRERFVTLLYLANGDGSARISNYFRSEQGRGLLNLFDKEKGEPIVSIGAWCLMPNHIHILIKEIKQGGISKFMGKLLTAYSMYFNIRNKRSGALFESRFKSEHIDNDRYLKYLYCYIHLNPIKIIQRDWKTKGIKDLSSTKKFLNAYEFSSLPDYLGRERKQNIILNTKDFPAYFEEGESFEKFHNDWLDIKSLS